MNESKIEQKIQYIIQEIEKIKQEINYQGKNQLCEAEIQSEINKKNNLYPNFQELARRGGIAALEAKINSNPLLAFIYAIGKKKWLDNTVVFEVVFPINNMTKEQIAIYVNDLNRYGVSVKRKGY